MTSEDVYLPPLQWPDLPDDEARFSWYREVIVAYADLWESHVSCPQLTPAEPDTIQQTEARIGCALPAALRRYHQEIGALQLSETLCSLAANGDSPIQPLFDAYPGLVDRDL